MTDTYESRLLGEVLRRERHRRRERQLDAAAWFGVNQASYARWETGENRPDVKRYAAIADYLGVGLGEVHGLVHRAEPPSTLQDLREQIAEAQRDIADLRRQVRALHEVIGSPGGRRCP